MSKPVISENSLSLKSGQTHLCSTTLEISPISRGSVVFASIKGYVVAAVPVPMRPPEITLRPSLIAFISREHSEDA
jgi:hypothetical protein